MIDTERLTLQLAKDLQVPMSVIDGRPWVPTVEESDPGEEGDAL